MSGRIKVTLYRAVSKGDYRQQKVLHGLNLRKRHQTREYEDTPSIRGMIAKVSHMVTVEKA